jgi:hypothetical protein
VIGVDQNASVNFTLSVPLIDSHDGTLHVFEGSRLLGGHDRSISVPSAIFTTPSPPAMLVISPTAVDCGRYVEASKHLVASSSSGPYYMGRTATDSSVLAEVVQPDLLPESWIDYSGLDFLALSRDDFEHLEHPVRTAIVKWVQCGGNLLVYNVGSEPAVLAQLDRLISAPELPATAAAWHDANPADRPTGEVKIEAEESSGFPMRSGRTAPAKPSGAGARGAAKPAESPWRAAKNTFHSRELMLGTVYAFAENPFPGSINDWLWLCKSCGPECWSWTTRHGSSPHFGTKDFFKFMNLGIHGVPTIAFFVLITVFGVVIGPVNYVYLGRKKMLWLLLFTVPALAFTTSALLVGYSMAAHGFATQSRIRSLTVLDQHNQTAVTTARLALFAGVAPSGGMRFSPDTAVYPVIPTTNEPRGGFVDWSETQHLASGWLPARTRTQFYTVRNAEQRARVEFKPGPGTSAQFANGLPWELEMVLVSDPQGHLHTARSVAAGGTVALAEATSDELRQFSELLRQNAPALPPGFVEPTVTPFRGGRAWMSYMMRSGATTEFSTNLMERRLSQWSMYLTMKTHFPPRTYLAVVRENPGVETGVSSTSDSMSLHVLNGNF